MSPKININFSVCPKTKGFWVLVFCIFHLASYSNCAFLHLDKNYLLPGEQLSGTLFTNSCGKIFPQVRLVLFDSTGQQQSESWIRLDSSTQPFQLEVPATIPEGLYQLIVLVERSQRVIYTKNIPLFKPEIDIDLLEPGAIPIAVKDPTARGLSVQVDGDIVPGATLELEITQQAAEGFSVPLSVRISDQATTLVDPLPTATSEAYDVEDNIPLSSHTFALEGYLSDSLGNGCNYCQVILTIPKLEDGIYYTKTDATGSFAFTGLSHNQTLKAYLSYQTTAGELSKQFFIHNRTLQYQPESNTERFEAYKRELYPKLGRHAVSKTLEQNHQQVVEVTTEKPLRPYEEILLYPKYDEQVMFDDYYLGQDMRKTIKSIVPFVNTIKKQQLRVFSVENRKTFQEAPLILLDGIPIDGARALALDPRTIYKVEVLHRRRTLAQVGNLATNGVLSFISKNGIDETEIPGVKKIYIRGFDNSVQPASGPSAHSFQRVLHWNPSASIESGGSYKVSLDLPDYYTEMLITVIGINDEGDFIYYQGPLSK